MENQVINDENVTEVLPIVSVDSKKARFSNAPWFNAAQDSRAIVGGVGNIGSWVTLFLARQGVTIYAYDKDTVGIENIASQLYTITNIGNSKLNCIESTLTMFVNDNIAGEGKFIQLNELTSTNKMIDKYCFSCFDNMSARKLLFESWVDIYGKDKDAIFIDGRLLAEIGQVFFVTTDKIEQYRATLFDDSEVALEDCAYKGTTHCSAMIAGLMVSGFNNFLVNLKTPIRSLPFNIDFQLAIFNFDIK